jgi:hypothetical protein
MAIGVLSLAIFAWNESRVKNPAFPIKLLTHPAFIGAVIMGIFWNFAAGGLSQMLPNMWQYVTHITPSLIGIAQLPMSAAGIVGSLVAGALLSRGVASRFISVTGYGFLVLAFIELAIVGPTSSYIVFVVGMVLAGLGYMMNATTQGNLFLKLAPAKFYGAVTSSKMAVGQFGYALGLTGTSTAISMVLQDAAVSQCTVTSTNGGQLYTSPSFISIVPTIAVSNGSAKVRVLGVKLGP